MARDRLVRVALVLGGGQLLAISVTGLVSPERLLTPLGVELRGRLALVVLSSAALVPRLRLTGLLVAVEFATAGLALLALRTER